MSKLIAVVADLQVPYHDPKYVEVLAKFAKAMRQSRQWDFEIGQVGDLGDQPQVGRWNKSAAGEFAGDFWQHVAEIRRIISYLGLDWVKVGNHDERYEKYIADYAPALAGEGSELTLEALYRVGRGTGTKLYRQPFRLSPGWICAHGHEQRGGGQVAGRTAFALAERWDRSVVCGHTHRAGTVSKTIGMPKARRRITGMEVGHGMLEKYATYTRAPNWQKAFGLFVVEGGRTYEHLVMMRPDNSFAWDGRIWKP